MKTSKFFVPALILGVILSMIAVVVAFSFMLGDISFTYAPTSGKPDTAPTLPAPPAPPIDEFVASETVSTDDDYVWFGDSRIRLPQEDAVEPIIDEYWRLKTTEIIEAAAKEAPTLEYTCPYEDSKCVGTMEFTDDGKHFTTWDIYLFNLDNVIGTWIVNEAGNDITFYGDAYLYTLDNTNVHMGSCLTDGEKTFYEGHLCVYPNRGTDVNDFMVVTYPWEPQLPLVP